MRVRKEEIKTVENRETIAFNGKTLSLARLENALDLPPNANAATDQSEVFLPVAVLTSPINASPSWSMRFSISRKSS